LAVGAPKPHGRVEILDLLRAVAVLAVLIFHYGFRGSAGDQNFTDLSLPALAPYAKYGFLGVQLFFVISGFVIAYSAERRSALEFGIARIARIYPGFIVCMTLTFIVTLAFGAPRFQATFTEWLANFIIAAPGLRQPFMDGAYWSLVCEVIFYAWFALLLMTGWRRHIDVVIIVWMALAVLNHEVHSSVLQRVFLTDQSGFFAAGLVIYEMYCGRRDATIKLLLALSSVIAVGQSLDLTQWGRVHYQVAYDDRVAGALSLLVIAAVGLSLRVRRLPISSAVVVGIGGITYPLYLLHQNIGYMMFNAVGNTVPPLLVVGVTAAGVTLLAWIIWRFVERPGQRLVKRLLSLTAAHLRDILAVQRLTHWRSS
jgi:peptidoglycan/LPS O-acetylase OafA/YrhL